MCNPHFPLLLSGARFFFFKGERGAFDSFRLYTHMYMRWVNAAGTQNTDLYKGV